MANRLQFLVVTASSALLVVLLLGTILGRGKAADGDAYKHFAVFSEVVGKIKSEYVEEPNMHNVTLGALNGLLEAIDPYGSYLSADQYKQYRDAMENKKADVGLVLSRRSGYIGIVDSIPGSPAAILGLNTYDIIEAINGVSTRDMPLAYAKYLLRGDPGTSVELSVIRVRRGADSQKVGLTRAVVDTPAVTGKMLPGEIAHIQVPVLAAGKTPEVVAKIKQLQQQGAKKVVLDLRSSGAGPEEEGIALADSLLDKGLITTLEGQKVAKKTFDADAEIATKLPLVVLTNRGTAGGAEIAASALLDNRRAEVVGERTYGRASLQKALTLEDGSAVILAVAKYQNGAGKAIQDNGVTPSLVVADPEPVADPDSGEDPAAAAPAPAPAPSEDLQLKKAIEVLAVGLDEAKKKSETRNVSGALPGPGQQPRTPLNIPQPPR